MSEHPLMMIAWRDFLSFAIGYDPLKEAFTADTGIAIPSAPDNPLDAMIDDATGAHEEAVKSFVMWATVKEWGDDGVPDAFLDEAKSRFPDPRPTGDG